MCVKIIASERWDVFETVYKGSPEEGKVYGVKDLSTMPT